MKPQELPENIKAKLDGWLTSPNVLHFWESEGTYFIVASNFQRRLYFLRIFSVGDSLELSQDGYEEAS